MNMQIVAPDPAAPAGPLPLASANPPRPPALAVRGLGKSFLVPRAPHSADPRREPAGRRRDRFHVLRALDFDVARGETLGLIGPNGSGKSTLLKILSGVMQPDSGAFTALGRVGALLELGAGFHPELSGVQNVYLTGALLGCTHAQISRLLPGIIGFSELERTIDLPVKHFSSGMVGRLGFAVAAHIAPEILLMDETFATGDAGFQAKALARIAELKAAGHTMILVSHNIEILLQMADRVLWIDKGQLRRLGPPREVLAEYRRSQQANLFQVFEARNHLGMEALFEIPAGTTPLAAIGAVNFSATHLAMHAPLTLEVELHALAPLPPQGLALHIAWVRADDRIVAESKTLIPAAQLTAGKITLEYPRFELTEGPWRIALALATPAGHFHARKTDAPTLTITTPHPLHLPAALDLEHHWT